MPQSRKVRIGSKLTMVWGRKILEKTFQDENIVGLVEATLVAEAILQVQRERVKEYSEPIWRKHWHFSGFPHSGTVLPLIVTKACM